MRTGAAAIPTAADAAGSRHTPLGASPSQRSPASSTASSACRRPRSSPPARDRRHGRHGGFLKGIAQSILDGTFGTPGGREDGRAGGDRGRPRTHLPAAHADRAGSRGKGRRRGEGTGSSRRPRAGDGRAAGGRRGRSPAVAATAAAGADTASRVAQMAGKTVSTLPRARSRPSGLPRPTRGGAPGTMGSVGAAATDAAINDARSRPIYRCRSSSRRAGPPAIRRN